MPSNWPSLLEGLVHELLTVEAPALEDNGHFEEVLESVVVRVELPVFLW